jgi:hypothetical protein
VGTVNEKPILFIILPFICSQFASDVVKDHLVCPQVSMGSLSMLMAPDVSIIMVATSTYSSHNICAMVLRMHP